ncbi:MAG: hypothetical protein AMS24_02370 [Chlamydiae bacterium SM23_39]|nr:MAG: hypothetical protein AMS24_02370 [Chlamydiae bacterium SM23_39]
MSIKYDTSINILKEKNSNLNSFFNPKNVAVIGATDREGSVGKTLVLNLIKGKKNLYLVNPKRDNILNIKTYPNIGKISDKIDLAIIATPAKTVPKLVLECIKAKVSSLIIISSGFGEIGGEGIKLENEIKKYLSSSDMRVIGPNCLGIINTYNELNATFASDMPLKGNIAFVSQSGALCSAVLDWSLKEKIGFSYFVSIGSMIDVGWGDLLNYLGTDPNTSSILIYMESIKNASYFLSAAREFALLKPVILIKAGKTEESKRAILSHTGALTSSDEVLNVALKRVGVLRVDTLEDLFSMAEVLSNQPIPKGPNLSIITNAGGPSVVATDELIKNGGKLSYLDKEVKKKLNKELPSFWSHNNPIDILGDADADRYYKTLDIITKDKNSDGILLILTPQYMTNATEVANRIKNFKNVEKPILVNFMGGKEVEEGKEILHNSHFPTFSYPDEACKTFSYMWKYSSNLKEIYEISDIERKKENKKKIKKRREAEDIFEKAIKDKRFVLDEHESKKILQIFDIPINQTYVARTKKEANSIAEKIKYPVVLKVLSKEITHKSDIGGVKLNIVDKKSLEKAYDDIFYSLKKLKKEKSFEGVTVQKMIKKEGSELIIGSFSDISFGPVLLFGAGGKFVEIFKDYSLALPPLNSNLANSFIKDTKIYKALLGFRNQKKVDLKFLKNILIRFSNLISEYPIIKECDINPLLAFEKEIVALDARIVLHKKDEHIPLAIRPYPAQYISFFKISNTPLVIRPIKPEDEKLLLYFFKLIFKTKEAKKFLKEIDYSEFIVKKRLIHLCFTDYNRDIVMVVEINKKDKKAVVGIGRLNRILGSNEAEFSLIVIDKWKNKKIGTKILTTLLDIAKKEKIKKVKTFIHPENIAMKKLCQKKGFTFIFDKDKNIFYAEFLLKN